MNLRNAKFAEDNRPVDPQSSCAAANGYARAYLHHLVKADEMLGKMLLTWINLAYYQDLMTGLRAAIAAKRLDDFIAETRKGWAAGDP
jgi:queuine tRNA-ribosyltransferase